MTEIRFAVGDADAGLAERLDKEISAFNAAVTGHHDGRMLSVAVRGDGGDLRAGLYGWTWGGCGYIDLLWVRADQRGAGLGTRLLAAAETEIRRRGCDRVALSTHSFQAPAFYARFGYTECGRTPGYPHGHDDIHLVKQPTWSSSSADPKPSGESMARRILTLGHPRCRAGGSIFACRRVRCEALIRMEMRNLRRLLHRSRGGGSPARVVPGTAEAALTKPGCASIARWCGIGERDGKYARNPACTSVKRGLAQVWRIVSTAGMGEHQSRRCHAAPPTPHPCHL